MFFTQTKPFFTFFSVFCLHDMPFFMCFLYFFYTFHRPLFTFRFLYEIACFRESFALKFRWLSDLRLAYLYFLHFFRLPIWLSSCFFVAFCSTQHCRPFWWNVVRFLRFPRNALRWQIKKNVVCYSHKGFLSKATAFCWVKGFRNTLLVISTELADKYWFSQYFQLFWISS